MDRPFHARRAENLYVADAVLSSQSVLSYVESSRTYESVNLVRARQRSSYFQSIKEVPSGSHEVFSGTWINKIRVRIRLTWVRHQKELGI